MLGASLHPQNRCSYFHKTSFLWDHSSLSHKTSFSKLNIFVGATKIMKKKKVSNSTCDGLENLPEFDLGKPLKWPFFLAF